MPLSERRKAQRDKQFKKNAEAKAKQDAQISGSKQSRSDNRGSSNSNINPVSGKPKTQQEIQWDAIKNENTSFGREEATKKQQTLTRGVGGGVRHSVQLNETLRVRDAQTAQKIDRVERRTKQIKDYLNEQRQEKQQSDARIIQLQKQYNDAVNYESSPIGKSSNEGYYNRLSRGQKRRGLGMNAPAKVAVRNALAKLNAEKSKTKRFDDNIDFFKTEQTNLKQEIVSQRSGSFSTGDDSRKTSKKPPPHVSQSIRGIGIAGQNYNKIKDFFGFGNPNMDGKPQTQIGTAYKPKVTKQSNSIIERFTPNQIEYGTARFSNAKFGDNQDYFSLRNNNQNNSQITTLPSGQVIEVKKPKQTTSDRYIAGLASVPQNLFTLGKEGVDAVASDVKQGKIGTKQPSELKKDIIISPLGAITENIGDPNYFQKTGKSLGDLGADIKKDPFYYAGNTVSNALLIAGTLGIGKAPAIAKKLTPSKEAKAKAIIDFTHPPQDVMVTEFAKTGKTTKTKSGFELEEYQPMKIKRQELETFGIQSSKQGDNIKLAGTEPTGKTKTQKVSPIESFEKVGDTYGFETYKATFKNKAGKFGSVEAIMTPNPILRYSGKVQKSPDIFPTANKGIKLNIETGSKIKSAIEANPSQSKSIFDSYAMKGKGGEFFERPPSNDFAGLTEFGKKKGNVIGSVKKASPETLDAMGARGKEIATQESFYFDDLFGRLSANKQYANLLQEGKIKSPKTDIPKQTLSLDSQYFAPDYLTGETSITTAFDIKTKQPSKHKKVTPYEKQFFDESVGLDKPRDFKKMKGFDLDKPPKSNLAESENSFGLLTKKQQDNVLSDLKGGGDFTKTTQKSQQNFGFSFVNEKDADLIGQSQSQRFDKPQKQDAELFSNVFSGFNEKQNYGYKMSNPLKQKADTFTSPALDLDMFKGQKQNQPQDKAFGFAFDNAFDKPTKTKTTVVNPPITEPIIMPDLLPEPPTTPPFRPTGAGAPPLFVFNDSGFDELLFPKKKGRGKKRFHNVDPTKVLGHFDGGTLGYQSVEYKQLKGKGKKKRKKNQMFNDDFSNIGF